MYSYHIPKEVVVRLRSENSRRFVRKDVTFFQTFYKEWQGVYGTGLTNSDNAPKTQLRRVCVLATKGSGPNHFVVVCCKGVVSFRGAPGSSRQPFVYRCIRGVCCVEYTYYLQMLRVKLFVVFQFLELSSRLSPQHRWTKGDRNSCPYTEDPKVIY